MEMEPGQLSPSKTPKSTEDPRPHITATSVHPSKEEKDGSPRWGAHGQRVRLPEAIGNEPARGWPPCYKLRTRPPSKQQFPPTPPPTRTTKPPWLTKGTGQRPHQSIQSRNPEPTSTHMPGRGISVQQGAVTMSHRVRGSAMHTHTHRPLTHCHMHTRWHPTFEMSPMTSPYTSSKQKHNVVPGSTLVFLSFLFFEETFLSWYSVSIESDCICGSSEAGEHVYVFVRKMAHSYLNWIHK